MTCDKARRSTAIPGRVGGRPTFEQRAAADGIEGLIFRSGTADQLAEVGDGLRLHDGERAEVVDAASVVVHVDHYITSHIAPGLPGSFVQRSDALDDVQRRRSSGYPKLKGLSDGGGAGGFFGAFLACGA